MSIDRIDFGAIFHDLFEPVLVVNGEGNVAYKNPAAEKILPNAMLSGGYLPLFQEEISAMTHHSIVVVPYYADGRNYNTTVTRLEGGNVLIVFRPQNEERRDVTNVLDGFVTQARDQISMLLGATQQLERRTEGERDEEYVKCLSILSQNVCRFMHTVDNVELAQRINSGKIGRAQCKGTVDLVELCKELMWEVESAIHDHSGVTFSYECPLHTLPTTGNRGLLYQAILAVVSNAVKAAGQNGTVRLRLIKRKTRAIITVSDDGPGMSDRDLAVLFEEGGTVYWPEAGKGMGLGLPNTRRLIELHGGVVMVESREDEGVTVTMSLPIQPPKSLMMRSPTVERNTGFAPVIVGLADLLPWQAFTPESLN